MPITANELRTARRMANLTQSELAGRIGVSKRTVVNWERHGAMVPERAESTVREVLDFSILESEAGDAPDLLASDATPSGVDPALRDEIYERIFEGSKRAFHMRKGNPDEAAHLLADTIIGAREAVKFAENASKAGAHPGTVMKIIEGAMAAVVETGAGAIQGTAAQIFIEDVIGRGAQVARQAVNDYVPGDVQQFDYVDMGMREGLREKEARANLEDPDYVGGSGEDVETQEQNDFGLAAKKRSKNRGEVDYE